MSTVTGIRTRLSPGNRGLYRNIAGCPKEGVFVKVDGQKDEYRQVADPCPYCLAPMSQLMTPVARVTKDLADGSVMVDQIPPTYRVLVCRPCTQTFVSGSEGG